jgi:hypothetical protein
MPSGYKRTFAVAVSQAGKPGRDATEANLLLVFGVIAAAVGG